MENNTNIKTNISFSLKKSERLCSKKVIGLLFNEGKSFLVFPFKIVFLETQLPATTPAQVAFSVSKKKFKRAVHRNRIKRLMREAYRLNKHELYKNTENRQLAVFFIFVGEELPTFKKVNDSMKKAIRRIAQSFSQA